MDKKIDASAHTGDAGVALVHLRTNQMGFVWHDRVVDAGIDGTIELRTRATGVMTNRHLLVQSKASGSRFPGENDRAFHFRCDPRDIDYWMRAELPVLLVCSHPDSEEAWWMHVQGWFADPVRRASGRIDFDKLTQPFDKSATSRLLSLADPHADAYTVAAEHRPEVLVSNLLKVDVPQMIFSSATSAKVPGDVRRTLRSAESGLVRADWTLHGGRIFSFLDPAETSLREVVTSTPDVIGVDDLLTDPTGERNLVRLLNRALIQDVSDDCTYHRGRDVIFFMASEDLTHRKIIGGTGQSRLVFHAKHNKAGVVSYYKHAALRWQFLCLDGQWVCALSPDAHYTRDGSQDSRFIASLLSGLKRLDRNPAVLGHVRMWAAYLRGEDTLLNQDRQSLLSFGDLACFDTDLGIDDVEWLADRRNHPADAGTAVSDAEDAEAPSLFDEAL